MQTAKKNALKAFMVSLFFPVLYWLLLQITEETAFRGLMVTRLYGHMASWLLVVLSGLTFALFHAPSSLYQAIMIIPVGLILCIVFLWTRSIRATIIMHMTNNILNSIIRVIPVLSTISTNSIYMADLIVSLVGLAVSITAIILLHRCRKSLNPTASNNV